MFKKFQLGNFFTLTVIDNCINNNNEKMHSQFIFTMTWFLQPHNSHIIFTITLIFF